MLAFLIALILSPAALAQDTAQCPTIVQQALTALELACGDMGEGHACYVAAPITATILPEFQGVKFDTPGDIINVNTIQSLQLAPMDIASETWGVAAIRLTEGTDNGLMLLAFGDVTLSNAVANVAGGTPTLMGTAPSSGVNIRRGPTTTDPIVWPLAGGAQVLVTGRHVDGQWLRVEIPGPNGGIGWVYRPALTLDGDPNTLDVVGTNSPAPVLAAFNYGPMQAITLQSGIGDGLCPEAPDSGLLAQSATLDTPAHLQVDGVDIALTGTAYMEAMAGRELSIILAEGTASVQAQGSSVSMTAGTQVSVLLDDQNAPSAAPTQPAPIREGALRAVPLGVLPRVVASGGASVTASPVVEQPTPAPQPTPGTETTSEAPSQTTATSCILTVTNEAGINMRTGPGTDYEVAGFIPAGRTVSGIGRSRGALGYTWYQLPNQRWIRQDTAEASGDCANLPAVEVTPPPPTAVPTGQPASVGRVMSETFGNMCTGTPATGTGNGLDYSVGVGGRWTAAAGTTITFRVSGSTFQRSFGNYISLNSYAGGLPIAASGGAPTLTHTFASDTTFTVWVSAGKDEVATVTVTCSP